MKDFHARLQLPEGAGIYIYIYIFASVTFAPVFSTQFSSSLQFWVGGCLGVPQQHQARERGGTACMAPPKRCLLWFCVSFCVISSSSYRRCSTEVVWDNIFTDFTLPVFQTFYLPTEMYFFLWFVPRDDSSQKKIPEDFFQKEQQRRHRITYN